MATGKYFRIVDGDDWVDTDAFVRYVEFLEKTDADVVATPFHRVCEKTKHRELMSHQGIQYGKEYKVDDVLGEMGERYQMHGLTFKTEIMKKIDKISRHCFYVDQEYVVYPLKYINTIYFLNEPVYQYRIGNENQSVSIRSFMKNRKMHKRVIENTLRYYKTENLSSEKKEFLKKRIATLVGTQIRIYLSFKPSKKIKGRL